MQPYTKRVKNAAPYKTVLTSNIFYFYIQHFYFFLSLSKKEQKTAVFGVPTKQGKNIAHIKQVLASIDVVKNEKYEK